MSSPGNALSKITEIGNYVVPTFGAVITSALALGSITEKDPKGIAILIDFAVFTILASYVSYGHRLAYLRYRRGQEDNSEEPSHLPSKAVVVFMIVHGLLLAALLWRLWCHGAL